MQLFCVTIIEIRPFRNGWQVYESAGIQPVSFEPRASDSTTLPAVHAFGLARFAFSIRAARSSPSFRSAKEINNW